MIRIRKHRSRGEIMAKKAKKAKKPSKKSGKASSSKQKKPNVCEFC